MHDSCHQHHIYRLTCAAYDALLIDADGRCQRCLEPTVRMHIDHDHAHGRPAVRGLLCPRCNLRVAQVDNGQSLPDPATTAYLARTTYHQTEPPPVVDTGNTPIRTFRVPNDLWEAALQKTRERGETVSDVVRRALERYVK